MIEQPRITLSETETTRRAAGGSSPRRSLIRRRLVAAALALLALSACSTASPPLVASPSARSCPAEEPAAAEAGVVSAASLCAIDGRDWQIATFVSIFDAPAWDDPAPSCEDVRPDAWWGAWREARVEMVTIDIGIDDDDASTTYDVRSVGVAVIDDPDPGAAIDLIEAEVGACLTDTSRSERIDHGEWTGVSAPERSGSEELNKTWWVAVDDRWALVQVPIFDDGTSLANAGFDAAVETVLDAQLDLLRAS